MNVEIRNEIFKHTQSEERKSNMIIKFMKI